jgi:hypothetical protein
MIRESKDETTLQYNVEPAVVAEVCQNVLTEIGKVTAVSRETGIITGYVGGFWDDRGRGSITLRIAKRGELTELHIRTSHTEGLLSSGKRATDDLAWFAQALGNSQILNGRSTGGW